MLSRALNKANTAVQLDNAQNYGAARDAYIDACELLQQVTARTNGEDDRKKLEAIRRTYTSRIEELDQLGPANPHEEKALPARPDSADSHGDSIGLRGFDNQSDTATITRPYGNESPDSEGPSPGLRRPSEVAMYSDFSRDADVNQGARQTMFSRSAMRNKSNESSLTVPISDDIYLPAPLSPRRPLSPARAPSPQLIVRQDFSLTSEREQLSVTPDLQSHRRYPSHESASWLDPIDESEDSGASLVHSTSSSRVIRKHIRLPSGDTEAEFDAALDAAVEAAYGDGYDDDDNDDYDDDEYMEPSVLPYDIEDEKAASMGREDLASGQHRQELQIQQSQNYVSDFFDANDSEDEEEHMLEEMTRGLEDFTLGQQSGYQSSIPRESDSSGLTLQTTCHSSLGSNPLTGTTALSVGSELASYSSLRKTSSSPPMPPPTQSLPQLPNQPSNASVCNRRISGLNAKQLKIETSELDPRPTMPLPPIAASSAAAAGPSNDEQKLVPSGISSFSGPVSMRVSSSPVKGINAAEAAEPVSPRSGHDDEGHQVSPTSTRPTMRKIFSSSSLKSSKSRQISVSHAEDVEPPPLTPLTMQVSNSSVTRLPIIATIPTPTGTIFAEKITGGVGGLQLFESEFHSPLAELPNSMHCQQQTSDVPVPLEPCPSDAMFRPFWLMRALYQTLAHPRGGYISNRLFVPRDAWKVKGVKLRNVEDKIGQCDLLTAALLKLARVDSTDADAVLEEMQSFESILETIQATLSRRLGAEVGPQGMVNSKDEKESEIPLVPRNNSMSAKGGTFSWRRLRSKGSAVNLGSIHSIKSNSSGGSASGVAAIPEREPIAPGSCIPSLPMVSHPSSRPAKRDVASVKFDGPNANYRACLARLFDAAQTIDQIARQVDDPGLRHADKTQVGLELCTRHVAEFFGFYICRFVMTDLGMLLDKFVKRGSEWVLG
ncbi:hypothetical protein GGS21DRAFT_537886 [Xylaria nigripes]|nr:hypothetical protein GGS21DRAFT_537886 [Xylaria nigripes]